MIAKMFAAGFVLCFSAVLPDLVLCLNAGSHDDDVNLGALESDSCPADSTDCDAGLSLRQLRGVPLDAAPDVEQQSTGEHKKHEGNTREVSGVAAEWSLRGAAVPPETWKLVADIDEHDGQWAWDVKRLKFRTATGGEVSPSTPGCRLVESGNAGSGYGGENAFNDDSGNRWGGRKTDDASGVFFLGITCDEPWTPASVELFQTSWSDHAAKRVHLVREGYGGKKEVKMRWLGEDTRVTIRILDTWMVQAYDSDSNWAWDVERLEFLTISGDEVSPSTEGCQLLESGNAGSDYGGHNAFRDSPSLWGGRKGPMDSISDVSMFYIGVACRTGWSLHSNDDGEMAASASIATVRLKQLPHGGHAADDIRVVHNGLLLNVDGHPAVGHLETLWEGSYGVRLLARSLSSGWAWDVSRLRVSIHPAQLLYETEELRPSSPHHESGRYCHEVSSGQVGHSHDISNAFESGPGLWGGRQDSEGKLYIGLQCTEVFEWPSDYDIYLSQPTDHFAREVEVQELTGGRWRTRYTVHVESSGYLGSQPF